MTSVIVVGGGIVGVACARELALAGAAVTLLHEGPIGGGATAAGMGHLIALDDHDPIARFTLRSLQLWDQLSLPTSCEVQPSGCLWVAEDEEEMAEAEAKRRRYAGRGVETEVVSAAQLRQLEPELAPGLAGGLLVPSDRTIYPPRAAVWLWEEAERAGASQRVARVAEVVAGRVKIESGETLEADWVLVATGDRMAELLPQVDVVPRKGHLLITARGPAFVHHQVVELGYVKKAHGREAESVACNVQPRETGQVLIGSSRQLGNRDSGIDAPVMSRMLARAAEFFPRLPQLTALRAWTGFRAATGDGAAVIGALEPGLAVAGGHEGVGITQAPATAELIRETLLGKAPTVDAAPFDPLRFGKTA